MLCNVVESTRQGHVQGKTCGESGLKLVGGGADISLSSQHSGQDTTSTCTKLELAGGESFCGLKISPLQTLRLWTPVVRGP